MILLCRASVITDSRRRLGDIYVGNWLFACTVASMQPFLALERPHDVLVVLDLHRCLIWVTSRPPEVRPRRAQKTGTSPIANKLSRFVRSPSIKRDSSLPDRFGQALRRRRRNIDACTMMPKRARTTRRMVVPVLGK